MRKALLTVAIVVSTFVLVLLSAATALWISVGGTFFRGERVTLGTAFQIGMAVLACVGLGFLIRWLFRAAKKT